MTTETLLKAAPDTPSVSGDGIMLALAGGAHELRFTARRIIRVENMWGSHDEFLLLLETSPVGTLAALLVLCDIAKDETSAIDLLDGVNWRPMREDVDRAWRKANWMPEKATAKADPPQGA